MPDIIHLLPDSVANQIAAGEVVQRPASVVKELLENSVDAGATQIDLYITDAGKTAIQVVDNGKGMSETDARLAFERHATSKISNALDLFNLHTMGFRGEALASIAAVAQVELRTRTKDEETGVSITMEGPVCVDEHPVACPVGANFIVRNLFYNVPARRRFLKSNITETNNIMREFERVALANPAVCFRLYKDNALSLDLKSGTFKQRIVGLFGQSLDKQLLPVKVETDIVSIDGFTGTPQSAKVKGFRQFLFVNDRYMRHLYFNKAIQAAYERLIPADKQVSFFLHIRVDPKQIDVNIHPSKTEIKFEDDRAIWQILFAAVRDALGRFNAVPTIDFDTSIDAEIPSFRVNTDVEEPKPQMSRDYNPFGSSGSMPDYRPDSVKGWESLYGTPAIGRSPVERSMYDGIKPPPLSAPIEDDPNPPRDAGRLPSSPADSQGGSEPDAANNRTEQSAFLQCGSRYIVTVVKSGLMIIDFVRAHRRILYDGFIKDFSNGKSVSQSLLFPELMQLSVSQSLIFDSLLEDMNAIGFDITPVGDASYAINGVPAAAADINAKALIMRLVEDSQNWDTDAKDNAHSPKADAPKWDVTMLYHHLAVALAASKGIGEGHNLSPQEMNIIVDELFACQTPNYTPDGKPIIAVLGLDNIRRLLK